MPWLSFSPTSDATYGGRSFSLEHDAAQDEGIRRRMRISYYARDSRKSHDDRFLEILQLAANSPRYSGIRSICRLLWWRDPEPCILARGSEAFGRFVGGSGA